MHIEGPSAAEKYVRELKRTCKEELGASHRVTISAPEYQRTVYGQLDSCTHGHLRLVTEQGPRPQKAQRK